MRAAREFVADALAAWQYPGDPEVAVLLTSEIVTNAVLHAATPFEVTVKMDDDELRITVVDGAGRRVPHVQQPAPTDTTGRGLMIVERLATSWGTEDTAEGGKAVWFTLGPGTAG